MSKKIFNLFSSTFFFGIVFSLIHGSGTSAEAQNNPREVQRPSYQPPTLDPRLPPVLPGQEVSDGKNTMKVWSSSGPVPVMQPPTPYPNENNGQGEWGVPGNVIIDSRQPAAQPKY